jgi:ribose-phosphate pyrophosphokinase
MAKQVICHFVFISFIIVHVSGARKTMSGELKLFTGNSNRALAEEISKYLGVPLGKATVTKFSDGETFVRIEENVRGSEVFVIQSICHPSNDNLMELLIMMDALSRASAQSITAVLPYYGYGRQDRKAMPRVPISAKLVANLITIAGADRVVTIDLHAGQIQGFFDIPVDNLFATSVLLDYIVKKNLSDLVIVSPDAGGTERARVYAKKLNCSLAIIDKRRSEPNVAHVMNVIGDVRGKTAIIVDDMIDTAGTLVKSAKALQEQGAVKVYAACTHPVLSGPAIENINNSNLVEVVVTNTIPLNGKYSSKIRVLSIAGLLAEAIDRIYKRTSVSEMFE